MKKMLLSMAVIFTALSSFADRRVPAPTGPGGELEDIRRCSYTCAPECRNLGEYVLGQTNNMMRACRFDTGYPPPPPPTASIRAFHSDNCSTGYTGRIDRYTDCQAFGRTAQTDIWGIDVDGQCLNIQDMPAATACAAFQNYSPYSVMMFHSDNCTAGAIATVNGYTNCDQLARAGVNYDVWGVQVNGQCINIQDTSFLRACELYKNER